MVANNGSDEAAKEQQGAKPTKPKSGILRLDVSKPRRLSGGSVEFRDNSQILGEETPTAVTSSPHQLSVTWATPFSSNEIKSKIKPTDYFGAQTNLATAGTIFPTESAVTSVNESRPSSQLVEERIYEYERPSVDNSNNATNIREFDEDIFGTSYRDKQQHINKVGKHEKDDEEDYSISVSAIMQRRASVRGYRNKRGSRSSRRASSTMDHVFDATERRRSSVYTTSSDEGTNQESTQEQIFENIRLHKEVIQSVKLQPWPMRKKLKLVRQAKTYVARHEGALQERFAMSRSTRDLWARFKILMAARWRHWKREMASFATTLIPWELRIKEIESHFGSGVASYFTFLRWLMSVNIMIAIPLVAFVIGPEYFATTKNETDPRKRMTEQEFKVAGNLFTIWEFEGYLKYSPMFYGYYSSFSGASKRGYKLPLAYFLTSVLVYVYSFVATLKKMAENSRNSKLSSKDDECTFSWKLFTGWDFMIGHAETAHNRVASVVVGFKEALLEEAEKKKDNHNWRIILQRILVNILVVGLLMASGYTVVKLVNESGKLAMQDNWLSRNAVNVTMTLLSFFLPMIFEALGILEKWHPRQQLRLQLARIMMLNLLNLYALMFSFIYNITSKEKPLQELKIKNETATAALEEILGYIRDFKLSESHKIAYSNLTATAATTTTTNLSTPFTSDMTTLSDSVLKSIATITTTTLSGLVTRIKCQNITVKCSKPRRINKNPQRLVTTTLLLMNLSTSALPPTTQTTMTRPTTTTTTTTTPPTPPTQTIAITFNTNTPEFSTTAAFTTYDTTTNENYSTTTLKPRKISTTPKMTSTVIITPITTSSVKAETEGLTSIMDTTAINNSNEETTITDNADDVTTTIDIDELPPTTTTMLPMHNETFFDYYDYFAGLPVDLETVENGEKSQNEEELLLSKTTTTKTNLVSKNLMRKVRQVTATATTPNTLVTAGQLPFNVPVFRKSIYSRRKHDGFSTLRSIYGRNDFDALLQTSTSTLPTTSFPWNYVTKSFIQETTEPSTTSKDSTEIETTTRVSTESINLIDNTNATSELRENDTDGILPDFIDDKDIIYMGEPSYYDVNDIDINESDICIRRICYGITSSDINSRNNELITTTTTTMTNANGTALKSLIQYETELNEIQRTLREVQKNLTSMCWETTLGQELSKVIVFDGLMGILVPLCIDFLRAVFVRYGNRNFCWDMEKTFPQYGDFKIAENILSLIYNQGQVWMGIFFSPGLVLINLAKLVIMMYFRSFIVLTCNVPHEVVFKASKSNNFYLTLLLTMLFLCVLPVGYAIVWLRPSWHCGPFSNYNRISEFITNTTRNALPKQLHEPLDYLTSSSTVIPLLLLLILIIYYLVSLTGALREANQDLRTQLHKEREEERKKMFKVHETKPNEPSAAALSSRWRKVLEASSPVTTTQPPDFETEEYKSKARKELISRIMKNALRKGSATSDEDSVARHGRGDDDDTDTEHHDSLPLDEDGSKDNRLSLTKFQQIRKTRKPSLVDIVQIAKFERDRERAAAIQATNNANGAGPRPKIDRQERKEKDIKSETNNKDNDPEVNTRIVNERRQSLLRRKRDIDENIVVTKNGEHQLAAEEVQLPVDGSHYAVVDEKMKYKQVKSGKTNDDKNKNNLKLTLATTILNEKKKEDKGKLSNAKSLNVENDIFLEGSEAIDISIPNTSIATVDKFSNFSKLGRKKFNNFLALVRDAVIANKNENDIPPATVKSVEVAGELAANSFNKNEQQNVENIPTTAATAIEIPLTPEYNFPRELTVSAFKKVAEELKIQDNAEEGDLPGPIVFSNNNNNNNNNNASQRRKAMERASPIRQDSKSSVWSDNIPTIMISMGSDECIVQAENLADLPPEHQIIAPSSIEVLAIDSTPTPTQITIMSEPTNVVPSTQPSTPAGAVINIIKVELEDEK